MRREEHVMGHENHTALRSLGAINLGFSPHQMISRQSRALKTRIKSNHNSTSHTITSLLKHICSYTNTNQILQSIHLSSIKVTHSFFNFFFFSCQTLTPFAVSAGSESFSAVSKPMIAQFAFSSTKYAPCCDPITSTVSKNGCAPP